jgi:hypothetical protein
MSTTTEQVASDGNGKDDVEIVTQPDIEQKYHQNAIHKGWLRKKKLHKNWKTRYVVLSEDRLCYYEHPAQEVPKGLFFLRDISVTIETAFYPYYTFTVIVVYGVYWFSTKKEDDLVMWLESIKSAAKKIGLESPSRVLLKESFSPSFVSKHQLEIRLRVLSDWMNYQLKKRGLLVLDTTKELADGKILHTLLEILCRNKLPAPNESSTSSASLEFVLELFQAEGGVLPSDFQMEDFVHGQKWAITELLYAFVLLAAKLQFANASDPREAMLQWCKMLTQYTSKVDILDFSHSFVNGMALCAILNKLKENTIDLEKLNPVCQRK